MDTRETPAHPAVYAVTRYCYQLLRRSFERIAPPPRRTGDGSSAEWPNARFRASAVVQLRRGRAALDRALQGQYPHAPQVLTKRAVVFELDRERDRPLELLEAMEAGAGKWPSST